VKGRKRGKILPQGEATLSPEFRVHPKQKLHLVLFQIKFFLSGKSEGERYEILWAKDRLGPSSGENGRGPRRFLNRRQ